MTALVRLNQLYGERASGELIASTPEQELRVVLHRGRLAWAAGKQGWATFQASLVEQAGADPERLGEFLASVGHFHAELGEQVVVQGLATVAQVRAALKAQVSAALAQLAELVSPRVSFLGNPGVGLGHNPGYTFELGEVLASPVVTPPPGLAPREAVDAVFGSVPEVSWVQALERGATCASEPPGASAVTPAMHASLMSTGARQALVVKGDSMLLGARLPGRDATVWARSDGHLAHGLARAVFAWVARGDLPVAGPTPTGPGLVRHGTVPAFEAEARALLARDPDVWVVAYSLCAGAHGLLGHQGLPLERWAPRIARRCALVRVPGGLEGPDASQAPVTAVQDDAGWWFGLPLEGATPGCLWVLGRPGVTTGLGFAVIRAFAARLKLLT